MEALSIEEKAKAYDEVREKIAIRFGSNVAEEIFSEYEESEDERIRKELICFLETEIPHCNARDKYIAWLEKQGKTFTKKDVDDAYLKGVCDAKQELEKQGEQKPYGQREECLDCQMNYVGECKGSCAMKRDEQKPAFEMITPEESLGVDSDTYNKIVDECIYGEQKPVEWSEDLVKEVLLSEVLPSFMHGGEADEVVAKLDEVMSTKVIAQPKTEWSEEDENTVASIISSLSNPQLYPPTIHDIEWLKSLKPQNTWKPSDEQMNITDTSARRTDYGSRKIQRINSYGI